MQLFLLLCVLHFCSADQKIENPTLPYKLEIHPLNVGDSVVIETELATTGLLIALSDQTRALYTGGPVEILTMEICASGRSLTTALDGTGHRLKEQTFDCQAEPGTVSTISILVKEDKFIMEMNGQTHSDTFKFPLILGKILQIRKIGAEESRVQSLMIKRSSRKPVVYVPRYRDGANEKKLVDDIGSTIGHIESCSAEATSKRHEFYWIGGKGVFVCTTGVSPPANLPYFELLPRWFDSCPCSCFSNPDDFIILKLHSSLRIIDTENFKTIIIEDWSRSYDLQLQSTSGKFAMEFFERPKDLLSDCNPFKEPFFRVNKDDNSFEADWKYMGNDDIVEVRKMNDEAHYKISTLPTRASAPPNVKTDLRKEIGFLRIKGFNRLEYKYRENSFNQL